MIIRWAKENELVRVNELRKQVNGEEAVAIRMIFDQYVNTDLGANGIAKYLENHGIHKIARQNGKNPLFDAALIRYGFS